MPYNGADGSGAGLINPVPRCRRRNDTAKVRAVKGSRVEIFSVLRLWLKKYYPSLDGSDRWRGAKKKNAVKFYLYDVLIYLFVVDSGTTLSPLFPLILLVFYFTHF